MVMLKFSHFSGSPCTFLAILWRVLHGCSVEGERRERRVLLLKNEENERGTASIAFTIIFLKKILKYSY